MRQDYAESSVILHTWMDEAEMQLNQGVAGVHEANFNHKVSGKVIIMDWLLLW